MSGGVDSSVAAHLLLGQGHEVVGVFMRHGEESPVATQCTPLAPREENDLAKREEYTSLLPVLSQRADHKQGCCSASDAEDARRVAERLDIPFYALNLQEEFQQIIDYFVDEYTQGRTPNPCVMCNNWLKFGKLFDYADSIGAEFVATGHYARLMLDVRCQMSECRPTSDISHLPSAILRGVDNDKDQSYVLFGIERELLPRMMLPVGGYTKPQIRELAAKLGLRVADKRDSQEICFVTSGKHDEFVQARAGHDRGGQIVTTDGQVVGEHHGIERFTVGQRKGLGVAMGERYFVVRVEPATRNVVIGRHDELARSELTAQRTNWQVDPPAGEFRCLAKIRYNARPAPAQATVLPDRRLHVTFDEPRFGVAPGQAVVCYDGDRMLGGGWIE
jgi:tRNA-specific 2-thiouridylase